MNSKPVILAAFALWCFVCARWYVCGIKEACEGTTPVAEVIQPAANGIEPDNNASNATEAPAEQTLQSTEKKSDAKTNNRVDNPPPVSPDNMDNVQMEKVEDRMVIYFPYQSSRKEDNAAIDGYLTQLAAQLVQSGQTVRITGHTDFVGEPKANYAFGLRRAYSIRDILIKKGVSKKQIVCKSYGDAKPVATNDTPYGRYLNRRAEIRVGK